MINVTNVSYQYNVKDSKALDNVSFTIQQGECIVLCGKSGCGKTTLTRVLNGLIPHFEHGQLHGHCSIENIDSSNSKIEDYVLKVGSVFQNPKTQYFNTNTKAELAFPCENIGMDPDDILKKIEECAKFFNISYLIDKNIFHLSGGEKQKVAFGASMMLDPKILVLDEVTSNLDSKTIIEIIKLIHYIKQQNVTIILAEHRLAWTVDFCDKYFYMVDGHIEHIYTKEEFIQLNDSQLQTMGLRSIDLQPYKDIIQQKENIPCTNPYLSIYDLDIGYSKDKIVRHIDAFQIQKGEILGLMGNNGIGKSTLIKTLCGLMRPINGEILIDHHSIKPKKLISFSYLVMQDVNYQLFSDSVEEEILLNCTNENYESILESLNLTELKDRHPMSLSGGQKQRVVIASALCSNKDIIYLDEPTSGLDRYHMEKVGQLLNDLKKMNKAVVVITHDEELAASVCDRIVRFE